MLYSSLNFIPVYGKFSTSIDELQIGDVFWYRVAIDPSDVADRTSETAKEYVDHILKVALLSLVLIICQCAKQPKNKTTSRRCMYLAITGTISGNIQQVHNTPEYATRSECMVSSRRSPAIGLCPVLSSRDGTKAEFRAVDQYETAI